MMERRVTFFSDGLKCSGVLRLPDGLAPGERRPAIVFCAGFSLVKEVWLPSIATALVDAGYITLNFDYRTFGESEGQPRCRLVPRMQVEDVRSALSFLETVDEVDAAQLAVFGVSLGASIAVGCAGVDGRVKACVAVAGPGDLNRVWSAFPTFAAFNAKVQAARRRFCATGEVSYVSVLKLLSSDPQTCALLEAAAPAHPTWRLEVTFESLADLFEFRPEDVAATIRAGLFIYPAADALVSGVEVVSMASKCRGEKVLLPLEGIHHHEIYEQGAGFAPIVEAARAFLGKTLAR
ncbi:MAG: alpha/beta fold hydrolase [Myxococcus sp.]|nr:alpha/beta fold hydrolase [Myxococcus sp.]